MGHGGLPLMAPCDTSLCVFGKPCVSGAWTDDDDDDVAAGAKHAARRATQLMAGVGDSWPQMAVARVVWHRWLGVRRQCASCTVHQQQ